MMSICQSLFQLLIFWYFRRPFWNWRPFWKKYFQNLQNVLRYIPVKYDVNLSIGIWVIAILVFSAAILKLSAILKKLFSKSAECPKVYSCKIWCQSVFELLLFWYFRRPFWNWRPFWKNYFQNLQNVLRYICRMS